MSETLHPTPETEERTHIPWFVFKDHVFDTLSDEELFERVLETLDARNLRKDNLIFTGFAGAPVHRHGNSFGDRVSTWGVTEEQAHRSIETSGDMNPISYLGEHGGQLPAMGVFDGDKLQPVTEEDGSWVFDEQLTTKDGSSLDSAAVCIFYFKRQPTSTD